MTSLKCGQCGHDNDLTRVFCQNCGARLERAEGTQATISAPTQVPTERPGAIKKRKEARAQKVKKVVGVFVSLLVTLAMSAAFAGVIEMFRQPEGVPAAKSGNEDKATQLYHALKTFSESTFPRAIDVKQDQANNYLACRLVSGTADTDAVSSAKAKFMRSFVVINEGKMRYYVEEQFLGLSAFMYCEYEPQVVDKVVTLKETGGGIGHVRFNEALLPLLDRLVGPVAKSALDVTDVVQGLNGLDFKPEAATLRWSGKPKAAGQ